MIKRIILIMLCALNLITITVLSTQNAEDSTNLSKSVSQKVIDTLNKDDSEANLKDTNRKMRNLAHFSVFLTLGILMYLTLKDFNIKYSILYAFLICVLYALFDESYQEMLGQGRAFEFVDLLKDWSGSAVGIALTSLLSFFKLRRKKV